MINDGDTETEKKDPSLMSVPTEKWNEALESIQPMGELPQGLNVIYEGPTEFNPEDKVVHVMDFAGYSQAETGWSADPGTDPELPRQMRVRVFEDRRASGGQIHSSLFAHSVNYRSDYGFDLDGILADGDSILHESSSGSYYEPYHAPIVGGTLTNEVTLLLTIKFPTLPDLVLQTDAAEMRRVTGADRDGHFEFNPDIYFDTYNVYDVSTDEQESAEIYRLDDPDAPSDDEMVMTLQVAFDKGGWAIIGFRIQAPPFIKARYSERPTSVNVKVSSPFYTRGSERNTSATGDCLFSKPGDPFSPEKTPIYVPNPYTRGTGQVARIGYTWPIKLLDDNLASTDPFAPVRDDDIRPGKYVEAGYAGNLFENDLPDEVGMPFKFLRIYTALRYRKDEKHWRAFQSLIKAEEMTFTDEGTLRIFEFEQEHADYDRIAKFRLIQKKYTDIPTEYQVIDAADVNTEGVTWDEVFNLAHIYFFFYQKSPI